MADFVESNAGQAVQVRLEHGQQLEAQGDFAAALAAYDAALAIARQDSLASSEARRRLGVTWMNRGNALQKVGGTTGASAQRKAHLEDSVRCYDEATAYFQTLPRDVPAHRNHLAAAWLNRGHALLLLEENAGAADTLERAIAELIQLPLDENPAYRLNLAGARVNLAQLNLATSPDRSHREAVTALELVLPLAELWPEFAEVTLQARRAIIAALGERLVRAESRRADTTALASEASDHIDDGLALAHRWEARGATPLRPLAFRLFQLGTQLYRLHQPQFLAEFVLENVGGEEAPFTDDPYFRQVADTALSTALTDLNRPYHFVAGTPQGERLLAISASLRAAQGRLRALHASPS